MNENVGTRQDDYHFATVIVRQKMLGAIRQVDVRRERLFSRLVDDEIGLYELQRVVDSSQGNSVA